ncbi:hypothetical protein IKF92_01440 [Candidatus Saccharibacteria bacterium]|nr:hypothetical protein [Candidatus Saccharibacteria bacterium]
MFSFVKQHKISCLVAFLNIVAVLVAILVIVLHNAKTATIDIYVAPSEAVIELNGKKYDNFTSPDIMPGDYHVKISMDGMQTKELDFEVFDGEFKRIRTYLLDEEGGFGYYLRNPDEILTLSEAADDEVGKDFVKNYNRITGIIADLPLEYYDRSDPANPIGVYIEKNEEFCGEKVMCLTVYGGEKNREIALNLIREAGYNPDDYGIVFSQESE